jgi:cell pole-organizing protein PopZ
MSVPNPSSSERDGDALRRAQRAHEPSMEEILASIRAIIADDRTSEPPRPAPKVAPSTGPQIVYSKDSPPVLRAVPEIDPPAEESAPAPAPAIPLRRPAIEAATSPAPEPEPEAMQAPTPEPEDQANFELAAEPPLLSDEADRAVSASFNALSTSVALQSAEVVESLTRQMLRPMIKTWLDEHLPSLVERLVRAEIQRVARGGR